MVHCKAVEIKDNLEKETKMPKITIDDKDYDTENFTEDQIKMLNEAQMNFNESARAEYTLKLHNERAQSLTKLLQDSLDSDGDQTETKS